MSFLYSKTMYVRKSYTENEQKGYPIDHMTSFLVPLKDSSRYRIQDGILIDETFERSHVSATDAQAYDERSQTFDLSRAFERKRPGFTKALRAKGKDAVFLELACGRAAHSLGLMKDGYSVISSDISLETVRWVKNTAEHFGIADTSGFAVIDALHLPFENETVDGVFMTASLHHVPSALDTLKECKRVLKKDGILLVGYEPAKWSYVLFSPLWKALKRILRHDPHRTVSIADDITMGFSMGEMKKLARDAGFQTAHVSGVDFFEKIFEHLYVLTQKILGKPDSEYRPHLKVLQMIDSILAHIPLVKHLSWNYDLIART